MNSKVFNGGSMAAWITAKEKLIMKFKGENVHHIILNEIPEILLDKDEKKLKKKRTKTILQLPIMILINIQFLIL